MARYRECRQSVLAEICLANSWHEKLDYVIDPERVQPALKAYYEKNPDEDANLYPGSFHYVPQLLDEHTSNRGITALVNAGQDRLTAIFFKDGKLDWESYVQVKDNTYAKFVQSPDSKRGVYRITLELDLSCSSAGKTCIIVSGLSSSSGIQLPLTISNTNPLAEELRRRLRPNHMALATAELEWIQSRRSHTINIKRLVCWELLGVGGEMSSTTTW